MKFDFDLPVVSEEKMFENVDIHTYRQQSLPIL